MKPPESLGEYGKAKWMELSKGGTFNADALALLCAAWETHLLARDAIRKHGVIVEASDGRFWNNPAVNAASTAAKDIVRLSKALGIDLAGEKRGGPRKPGESREEYIQRTGRPLSPLAD